MKNKENACLYEEFGIKSDDTYFCERKDGKKIIGKILNFCPGGNIAIKSKDGFMLFDVTKIKDLYPIKQKKVNFKVGDNLELNRGCLGDLVFKGKFLGNDIIATTLLHKGKKELYIILTIIIYMWMERMKVLE